MKKVLCFLTIMALAGQAFCATPWESAKPAGTDNVSDLDTLIQANNTALERSLATFTYGAELEYASASSITLTLGSVTVSNAAGSDRELLQNTSNLALGWGDIDTGSEATSTTYYVYAVGDSTADTFSGKISLSSTTPTGSTQYVRIGSFYNNSSGNITLINNDKQKCELGSGQSKSLTTAYQATQDGYVVAYISGSDAGATTLSLLGYTDSNTSPSTLVAGCTFEYTPSDVSTQYHSFMMPVKAGDYYKVTSTNSSNSGGLTKTIRFFPKQ